MTNEPISRERPPGQGNYDTPRLIDKYLGRQLTPQQLAVFNESPSRHLGSIAASALTLVRAGLGELTGRDSAAWATSALVAREFSS